MTSEAEKILNPLPPVQPVTSCSCGMKVVLKNSISPMYLTGKCDYCGSRVTVKAKELKS